MSNRKAVRGTKTERIVCEARAAAREGLPRQVVEENRLLREALKVKDAEIDRLQAENAELHERLEYWLLVVGTDPTEGETSDD